MTDKTNIILSSIVDATVKESQPDVDFKMFRQIEQLGAYLETDAIRASTMFITSDVIIQPNSSFSYIIDLIQNNNFLKVDRVVYITSERAAELKALRYLLDQFELTNWEIIEGAMTKVYVSEVIGGTFRKESFSKKKKAIVRKPRNEYIKQKMRDKSSLEDVYADDDTDLMAILDEPVPPENIQPSSSSLRKLYITGFPCEERTAFSLLAAQYLSLSGKTILVESDADYHSITEFVTKSEVDALCVPMDTLFSDRERVIQTVRETDKKLIIFICVNRFSFSYRFVCDFLFYTLYDAADYLVVEAHFTEVPKSTVATVVLPNSVIGCLRLSEYLDAAILPYCRFVAVSFNQVPEIHINSGLVLSKILQDVLSDASIACPIVTITSLRINESPYDLGAILNWR